VVGAFGTVVEVDPTVEEGARVDVGVVAGPASLPVQAAAATEHNTAIVVTRRTAMFRSDPIGTGDPCTADGSRYHRRLCQPHCNLHAVRMTQFVTRIDDDLAANIELVAKGVVESRSDAVRRGLWALIDHHRRRRTAEAIIQGYRETPQDAGEVGWPDEATIAMIREEPW
jgi:Arc/MetJ-type ribon-helix-helix transcriptional regulator